MAQTKTKKHRVGSMAWKHHTTYTIWYGMIQRCYNQDHVGYWNYGGAGIDVYEGWLYSPLSKQPRTHTEAFRNFVSEIGYRPSQYMSLDRIDPQRNYEPGNLRWATSKTQNRNKRQSLTIPDPQDLTKRIPVAELAERLGMTYQALRDKLQRAGAWPGDMLPQPIVDAEGGDE